MAKTLNPYEFSSELRLRPYEPFDPILDRKVPWIERAVDDGEVQQFDLSDLEQLWEVLSIQLHADLPEAELQRILPKNSDPTKDVELIVSLRCASTKLRRVTRLRPERPGSWSGELEILRRECRSVLELHPLLVRATTIPGGSLGTMAADKGAIIAEGRIIRITVDSTEQPVKGAPRVQWEDFRNTEHSWRKDHSSDLFYFEPDHRDPVLWLNSSYQGFREILHDAGEIGVTAGMRHLSNVMVAQVVWCQIFVTAASSIATDEDSGELRVSEGWRQDVLTGFLPRMFPEEMSEEARLRKVAEMYRSPDQVGTLLTRMGTAIQEIVGSGKLLNSAIRAVEKGSSS